MEHLPLPRSFTGITEQVVCRCDEANPYDGGDFATYPHRAGWPELLSSHTGLPLWFTTRDAKFDDGEIKRQEKVLTAWLFFGLLHMLFSPLQLYIAGDYIRFDELTEQRVLCTKSLRKTLLIWVEQVEACDEYTRSKWISGVRSCLGLAHVTFVALNREPFQAFDYKLKMCLESVYNVFEQLTLRWLPASSTRSTSQVAPNLNHPVRSLMLQQGWCPADIVSYLGPSNSSVSSMWYAQHIQKSNLGQDHAACNNTICTHAQMSSTYKPRHTNNDCICADMGPSVCDVLDCLRRGTIPVLEVHGNNIHDASISVKPADELDGETEGYVAFSHIWADGLGNPASMTLPTCQILRLRDLIHDIFSHKFFRGKLGEEEEIVHRTRLYLWCDTLCCPVQLESKNMALPLMRAVYINAEWTLVLDRELESFNYEEIGVVEAGWRLTNSHWMKRLWTYQEAGLALRLLIQYKDKPVSVHTIMRETRQLEMDCYRSERLYTHIVAEIVILRKWMHSELRDAWISNAVMGVARRSVSFAGDEPLCLATVFDLDIERITNVDHNNAFERMKALWQMICENERGVRESVIFNSLRRLQIPGYGWAPESFLQPIDHSIDFISLDDDGSSIAVLTPHGLQVKCSGWRLRLAKKPDLPSTFCPKSEVEDLRVMLVHPDGTCYVLYDTIKHGIQPTHQSPLEVIADSRYETYLMLSKQATHEFAAGVSTQKALLVSQERHDDTLVYRSRKVVLVDRLTPTAEPPAQAALLLAFALGKSSLMSRIKQVTRLKQAWKETSSAIFEHMTASESFWLLILLCLYQRRLLQRYKLMMYSAKLKTQVNGVDSIMANIIPSVMGRYAHVEEVYPADRTWIVD